MLLSKVASTLNVSRGTVGRIYHSFLQDDNVKLYELINPAKNRRHRRAFLVPAENQILEERIKEAACRGFAVTCDQLCDTIAAIRNDKRRTFTSGKPFSDAFRAWRSQKRDITFRKCEKKTAESWQLKFLITCKA